jgi:hypothetical protein
VPPPSALPLTLVLCLSKSWPQPLPAAFCSTFFLLFGFLSLLVFDVLLSFA